jgi:luciferase-like monooxygenase
MRFGLTTDFRNRPGSGKSSAQVYAETLDLFAWAETLGFGAAYVFEHHFTDDDYMSSPMIAATAIAARIKQMRVGPDIAILPLYDHDGKGDTSTTVGPVSHTCLALQQTVSRKDKESWALSGPPAPGNFAHSTRGVLATGIMATLRIR